MGSSGHPSALFIEPLGSHHDRSTFACGSPELDRYLQEHAGQDVRRRLSAVFILSDTDPGVAGYYTLSACEIEPRDLPEALARRLPRRRLPATLIGRLAVDLRRRGRGYGGFLLIDAIVRAVQASNEIGAMAIVVDAKDQAARSFYEHYGFRRFPADAFRLFLPMSDAERAAARALPGQQLGGPGH